MEAGGKNDEGGKCDLQKNETDASSKKKRVLIMKKTKSRNEDHKMRQA